MKFPISKELYDEVMDKDNGFTSPFNKIISWFRDNRFENLVEWARNLPLAPDANYSNNLFASHLPYWICKDTSAAAEYLRTHECPALTQDQIEKIIALCDSPFDNPDLFLDSEEDDPVMKNMLYYSGRLDYLIKSDPEKLIRLLCSGKYVGKHQEKIYLSLNFLFEKNPDKVLEYYNNMPPELKNDERARNIIKSFYAASIFEKSMPEAIDIIANLTAGEKLDAMGYVIGKVGAEKFIGLMNNKASLMDFLANNINDSVLADLLSRNFKGETFESAIEESANLPENMMTPFLNNIALQFISEWNGDEIRDFMVKIGTGGPFSGLLEDKWVKESIMESLCNRNLEIAYKIAIEYPEMKNLFFQNLNYASFRQADSIFNFDNILAKSDKFVEQNGEDSKLDIFLKSLSPEEQDALMVFQRMLCKTGEQPGIYKALEKHNAMSCLSLLIPKENSDLYTVAYPKIMASLQERQFLEGGEIINDTLVSLDEFGAEERQKRLQSIIKSMMQCGNILDFISGIEDESAREEIWDAMRGSIKTGQDAIELIRNVGDNTSEVANITDDRKFMEIVINATFNSFLSHGVGKEEGEIVSWASKLHGLTNGGLDKRQLAFEMIAKNMTHPNCDFSALEPLTRENIRNLKIDSTSKSELMEYVDKEICGRKEQAQIFLADPELPEKMPLPLNPWVD